MKSIGSLSTLLIYLFGGLMPTNASSSITTSWNFIVIADWHGAESFALHPVDDTTTNTTDSWHYDMNKAILTEIHDKHGGDLVMMPGDTNSGIWSSQKFQRRLRQELGLKKRELSTFEGIEIAGRNCYGTTRRLFREVGYDKCLVSIGDHELGGNPWFLNSRNNKVSALKHHRNSFAKELNSPYINNDKIIGNAFSNPTGTPFENTSFAYIHKNALFITVDAFQQQHNDYHDRSSDGGGEGSVTCTVTGEHLQWFENLLIAASTNETIHHIFVQAHVPVLQPVRKINCSGQFLDGGTKSDFWKLMVKYNVDVYFAGEVHATTVSKDSTSNLLQIVSRGNRLNNFLNVNVTDDGFSVMAYNEAGEKRQWNGKYEQYGLLTVEKSNEYPAVIESSGILKIINRENPIIRTSFERNDTFPLHERIVVGMKYNERNILGGYSKEIKGVISTVGMKNLGDFGQQYDAQIANIDFDRGINGEYAAVFNNNSRFAINSFGPFGQGETISFSLFFKTTESNKEMILLSYASTYSPYYRDSSGYNSTDDEDDLPKDLFLVTLRGGRPYLYTSHQRYITPIQNAIDAARLDDGQWHHIAVSMPKTSCLLSEIKFYIDGFEQSYTQLSSHDHDNHVFFYTTGSLSLGGWGYAHEEHASLFPDIQNFVGMMDSFHLWSRNIFYYDLKKSMKKKFERNRDIACSSDSSDYRIDVGIKSPKTCRSMCKDLPTCWGYELVPDIEKQIVCYIHSKRPKLGNPVEGAQCNSSQ